MPDNLPKVAIVSLGCSKNQVDSEVMGWRLVKSGYQLTSQPIEADIVIINSCGFIQPAREETIETILEMGELKREGYIKKIVVVGCMGERYREEMVRELPEVDLWAGVGEFPIIDRILNHRQGVFFSGETFLIGTEGRLIFNSPFHAYIKLSEGCNQRCAFCAIPSFKGKLQSRPIFQIVDEVKRLIDSGYRDFSLIAQDSSSYLWERGERFGLLKLIEELEQFANRNVTFRIQYLYPNTTTPQLIKGIAQSTVVENYFDFPLQHISRSVLKIMKRDISPKQLNQLLELMGKMGVHLRTTLLVGHPGEGEKEFQELMEFVKNSPFHRFALFQYSDEEGTVAHTYPAQLKVPPELASERLEQLGEVVKQREREWLSRLVGKIVEGYLEGSTADHLFYIGRPTFWSPEIDGDLLVNEVVNTVEGEKKGEEWQIKKGKRESEKNSTNPINLQVGGRYRFKITQLVGDELLATLLFDKKGM